MVHLATLIGEMELAVPALWTWLASACEPAASSLITAVWQGAVIVCGLEIAMRLTPRISAAHRFAVWAAGFVVAVGLPWLPLLHFSASGAGSGIGVGGNAAAPVLELDARWIGAIAALWVGASAVRAARLVEHTIRLRRLWKGVRPAEVSRALTATLGAVRGGRVAVCTTEDLDRPSVIGFFWPRILIPSWLMTRLTPGELEQIVLHEAEHLRRRDDWTNLLQKLALVAFPLNPALAWMEHQLCREREMACDERVVELTNAPRAYAACLASLAERGLERRAEALTLGAWHRRSELVHRVHGILRRKRRLAPAAAVALLGTLGCALIAGSVEMSKCPQLVAFVPAKSSLAMTGDRQRAMAAMLARENAEAKMTLPSGFRAVQARAVMPETNRTTSTHVAHRAARKGAAPVDRDAAQSPRQMARADVMGDRVNPAANEQWVVLAAWEEVQTVQHVSAQNSSTNATSDYDGNAVAEDGAVAEQQQAGVTSGQAASKTPRQNQTTSAYTVTRLILKVVPANSKSTQPGTGIVRGGWFVIQL
jgi:beta-lactamase regulating signal transducer with metallopeptidase domain